MAMCPQRLRAMKTSLPIIARPADRREYYEPATVCRSIGAEVAPSPAGYDSRSPERPAGGVL